MVKERRTVADGIVTCVFIGICLVTLYPFLYAFSFSVSDAFLVAKNSVVLWPRGFTLQNYYIVFSDNRILHALFISVAKTVTGTLLFLVVTGFCAYALSKRRLKARRWIFIFFVIPMYVNGGLLPYYVLIHDLGLFNRFLVYLLPTCFAAFFMFLIKVYLETISENIEESAMLDGAGDVRIALQMYMPLCKPVLAAVALFVGVNQWNSWFDALLYVTREPLQPLQLVLQIILRESQIENTLQIFELSQSQTTRVNAESYKMAVVIVTALPVIFLYPFVQKYFVKGMMIGAVKL